MKHTRWTPLEEGSDQRRDDYVTTHRTHKRQITLLPEEFEPQTYILDRAATEFGLLILPKKICCT